MFKSLCGSNKEKDLASTVKLREDSLAALVGKHHAAPEKEDTAHGDGGALMGAQQDIC